MSEKNETGKDGEVIACSYLEVCGYTILHTNWRFHRYELDIVATKGEELIIVEVKTRSEDCLVSPEQSINSLKIKRIAEAADAYIRLYDIALSPRFDVIFLTKNKHSYVVEEHIEDAFFAPVNK
ncbi:MAG: YraN family protein [Tannerella sp.]|jgi:putative endonuclease|nr:YraN family protein [Tannerella sp.]